MVRVRYSFGSRHTGRIANIKKQRQKYPDIMKKVLEISDIVLEVLDARYIEETRNINIEEKIDALGKKLVFVFNKCDLVNREELEKQIPNWMRPYVFVSATQQIGLNDLKSRIRMEAKRIISERRALGLNEDEKPAVKVKGKKVKTDHSTKFVRGREGDENWKRVHVGVIGVPNAGKSSVINFVTRRSAARTGAKAGFTKGLQKIRMSEDILILDTPGVIPEDRYTTERKGFAEDVKIGARSYSDVRDPERAVMFLVRAAPAIDAENLTDAEKERVLDAERNAVALAKFYGIEFGDDSEILVEELGKKKGFLGKGGVVDEDRSARLILRDWQEGKIRVK